MRRKLLYVTLFLLPLLLAACVNEEIDTKGTIVGIVPPTGRYGDIGFRLAL